MGAAFNGLVALFIVTIGGAKAIKVAERLMMILLIIFTTWITVAVIRTTSIAELLAWRPNASDVMPLGIGIDAMVAFSLSWSLYAGDFTRYTKTKISATVAPMLGATLALYWFALVGTLGVISLAITSGVFDLNNADPSTIAMGLGLGWVALIVVVFSTITTNMVDLYIGAYGLMNLFPKLGYSRGSLITGVVCIFVSWVLGVLVFTILKLSGFGVQNIGAVVPALILSGLIYYVIAHRYSATTIAVEDQGEEVKKQFKDGI